MEYKHLGKHFCFFFAILMQRKLQKTISATCNLISLAHNIFSNVFNIAICSEKFQFI